MARSTRIALVITLVLFVAGSIAAQTPPAQEREAASPTRLMEIFSPAPEGGPQEVKAFLKKIEAAINNGAAIDAPDQFGNTPLFTATYWAAWTYHDWGANDVVAYLLERGANPNLRHSGLENMTPLHMAAQALWPNMRLIELLCAAGADPNSSSAPRNISPLELSRTNRFPQIGKAMSQCASKQ